MKKKVGLGILFFLFLFFLLNYKIFLSYYYNYFGNIWYGKKNYTLALQKHITANDFFPQGVFQFNIGNDLFYLGETEDKKDKKIHFYTGALERYSSILQQSDMYDAGFVEKVQDNYDIVQKRLQDLEEKQAQSQTTSSSQSEQEPQEQEQQEGEQNQKNEEKEDESEKGNELDASDENQKQTSETQEKSSENESLSEYEQQQIEEYSNRLQDELEQNMQFFNKKNSQGNSAMDVFLHRFQGDPFFDTMFDNGGEKDW